jgi:Flp pilus assembly protein TadG
MLFRTRDQRRGSSSVETAVVVPVGVILITCLMAASLGVSQYHQVAHLACEAARFASTHGGQYAQDNATAIGLGTFPNVNENYITTQTITSNAIGLDLTKLTASVSINTANGTFDWDDTTHNNNRVLTSTSAQGTSTNTVVVNLTYRWTPPVFPISPITFTATSVQAMMY